MSAAFDYDANLAKILNDPERLRQTYDPYEDPENYITGESEVLTPTQYLERGNAVLEANRIAINNTPHRDVPYPDWKIRYVNVDGGHRKNVSYRFSGYGLSSDFTECGIEHEGRHWSLYNFLSKEVVNPANKEKYQNLLTDNVAEIYASAKIGAIFMANQRADADFDIPDVDAPRLWNSELCFQAWRDSCAAYSSSSAGNTQNSQALLMKKLKYIIICPISNAGTKFTIIDALKIKGIPVEQTNYKHTMVTFSSNDISTASAEFKMLMGTTNARPLARMLTDHVESLGAKRVVKIHAWLSMPAYSCPVLAFELAGEDPPAPAPAPAPKKMGRKISTKVQNLMKKFER